MVDPPPLIRPTPGPVRTGFRYDPATPFAPGQRRTTTFAARPGEPVAAPCRGRVTFVGRTPQGVAITVRCGAWTTTVLGAAATVRAGTTVAAGGTVGRASGAAVGLSLRPVAARWGYVDPRPSLAVPRTGTPLGRVPRTPRGRAPLGRAPRARRSPAPVADRAPARRVPVPAARPAPAAVARGDAPRIDPRAAFVVGAALVVLGLPVQRRRRAATRRRTRRPVRRADPSPRR